MENYNIEFKGIDLTVGGYYAEGEKGDWDNRGTSSVFEIEEVCVIDSVVNILDFFSADDLEVMSEKVIEFIEE
jgi:hypothetical protein